MVGSEGEERGGGGERGRGRKGKEGGGRKGKEGGGRKGKEGGGKATSVVYDSSAGYKYNFHGPGLTHYKSSGGAPLV